MKPQRRIVCAAIRFVPPAVDGLSTIIVCGVRHYDMLMNNQMNEMPRVVGVETQGFVDNFGEFVTRIEAWVIARTARQIIYRVAGDEKDGGTLFSENLY